MRTDSTNTSDAESDSDEDWDLEIEADGFPRYYMKKPPGGPHEYARPIPADVMLQIIKKQQSSEWKKKLELWWEVTHRVILKLLDFFFALFLYRMSCLLIRLTVGLFLVITCRRFSQAVFRPKAGKFPATMYLLNLIYHIFIPTTALRIFFWFDDRIDGPMFADPETQKYYVKLRFWSTQQMDVPSVLVTSIIQYFRSLVGKN